MPSSPDFFDEAQIYVAAGKGGAGLVHFRREKYVPLGGPDGGDGGNGGSVILEADPAMNTLHAFRFKRRFVAPEGSPGGPNRRHGKQGQDVVIRVPVGTVVREAETGEPVADLSQAEERVVVTRGGHGGLGNSHFATSTRQSPGFAEKGQPGEERSLSLELKLVADVGLVGLPNAGKSTLLSTMSAARPKIADYPFTTLTPNLGVVAADDYSFVVADIPGLIEGAHEGHGLGDRFLRHIERTRILVRVLDGSSEDPIKDFQQVTTELRQYDASLLEKPQIVALNKMDLPDARDNAAAVTKRLSRDGLRVVQVSGATHEGLMELVGAVRQELEALGPRDRIDEEETVHRIVYQELERAEDFTIERRRSTFYVAGEKVERIVSMTDMDSAEALDRLQRQLKRLGVTKALERAGVRTGAKVNIGGYELMWEGEIEEGLVSPDAPRPAERTERGNRRQTSPETRASRGRRRP